MALISKRTTHKYNLAPRAWMDADQLEFLKPQAVTPHVPTCISISWTTTHKKKPEHSNKSSFQLWLDRFGVVEQEPKKYHGELHDHRVHEEIRTSSATATGFVEDLQPNVHPCCDFGGAARLCCLPNETSLSIDLIIVTDRIDPDMIQKQGSCI